MDTKVVVEDLLHKAFPEASLDWLTREYSKDPIPIIAALNSTVPRRIDVCHEYTLAAVGLEIALDNRCFPAACITTGIPLYLCDGYTDLGRVADDVERNGREKFRVDKKRLLPELQQAKAHAIAMNPVDAVKQCISMVARHYPYDARRVNEMADAAQNLTVPADAFRHNGAVCRHQAVILQCMLQTAGIKSRVVKGDSGGGYRHVWNTLVIDGVEYLADATAQPDKDGVYLKRLDDFQRTNGGLVRNSRAYKQTPDSWNNYKIVRS
ncbi:transglutaminase domain-containing protein [Candidatus Woesearchaeota archaeon]|nr:transglutaminase domain-containing protein [Candidatus Woesearchaeota archaeon]